MSGYHMLWMEIMWCIYSVSFYRTYGRWRVLESIFWCTHSSQGHWQKNEPKTRVDHQQTVKETIVLILAWLNRDNSSHVEVNLLKHDHTIFLLNFCLALMDPATKEEQHELRYERVLKSLAKTSISHLNIDFNLVLRCLMLIYKQQAQLIWNILAWLVAFEETQLYVLVVTIYTHFCQGKRKFHLTNKMSKAQDIITSMD